MEKLKSIFTRKNCFNIVKIATLVCIIPLWFIRFMSYAATIPGADGVPVTSYQYFSLFENLRDSSYTALPVFSCLTLLLSAGIAVASLLQPQNRALRKGGTTLWAVSIAIALVFGFAAASVARGF